MSKCENCIHYECCCDWVSSEDLNALSTSENCATYKDKSLFVELSCEVGDVIHLIDKEFVNKALINELSRMAYENEEKEAKERGFARVRLNLPKPHKPHTNFDKITESAESLTKWIYENYGIMIPECVHCEAIINKVCEFQCEDCLIEWLQKEIEDENI